jgi:nanoRNase/pAp phosphatase (c-di-AMP/oligoRNAs hydrolase)
MDLTPKQQTTELIRQAQNILIVTGRDPNNDQLASAVGLHAVLTKLGKVANVVITDRLPKVASVLDTSMVAKDMQGVRDFIISLDMHSTQVDKVKYDVEGQRLDVTITPHGGNFQAKDVSFGYGAYQFDLVIALGVPSLSKLDRLHEASPTIFDGLHLINIDYHRINDNYGSVNLVDTTATCVAEILISTIESLGQGMIDASIATAFLASFMSNTANFTAPATTAKALTIAAQMMSAGAKQQEIVKALVAQERQPQAKAQEPAKVYSQPKPEAKKVEDKPAVEAEGSAKSDDSDEQKDGLAKEPKQTNSGEDAPKEYKDESDGSKKNSINRAKTPNNLEKALDAGQDESKAAKAPSSPFEMKSPLEAS